MATVRELVAKFGFDIDTKPLDEFNDSFDKTKKSIQAFAVFKVVKAASSIASEFQVAARQIALMGGELEALNIVSRLNRIVTSSKDALMSIRNAIEATTDPKFIGQIAQDVENLAAITGKSFNEIMSSLTEFVNGSDEAGIQLGIITRQEVEARQRAGLEFTRATRQQQALNRLTASRMKNIKLLGRAQNDLDTQVSRTGKIFSDFAKFIGDIVNPVLAWMLDLFNDIAEFFLDNKAGKFTGAVLFLGMALKSLLTVTKFLLPVLKFISSTVAGFFNIFTIAGAAIAGMVVFIRDLWAAMAGEEPWFFSTEKSQYFKNWVRDIKLMGEAFDFLSQKISDMFAAGGQFLVDIIGDFSSMISGGVRSLVGDPIRQPAAEGKTANITINADTVEAGQAAGQETGRQMKQLGFSVNETTMNQLRARKATQAGG
jgi:hypothetical protein